VCYELLFEFLFAESIVAGARFFLEVLVFGGVGALVTWVTLEWLRRHMEQEQEQIRELNRQLETEVAERTRELSKANERLRLRQRELEKANAELEQLDELKSEFVSLVSHDLRAPLTNISGSLQLLLAEDTPNALTPNQREMLVLANEQTDHLTRLVKGVLDVTRIESGQMPLSLQAFDLVAVTARSVEQWQLFDTEHVWVGPDVSNLPSARGDRDRVGEVLANLFDNAAKYSKAGAVIHVNVQVLGNRLVVSVTDQGDGIAPDELEKIFNKFHRVERGDARKTYGYGLGLYISRKFIQAMGGELWAESKVGQGSTFYFSLPLPGQENDLTDGPAQEPDAEPQLVPAV
jgi:signal transduction histidine kinase